MCLGNSLSGKNGNCTDKLCCHYRSRARALTSFQLSVSVFSKTIFQTWNAIENNIGHVMSWKMIVQLWNFYNRLHK